MEAGEGDRSAGQEVRFPTERNMLGPHLLLFALPRTRPSPERVQMVFLSLRWLLLHGLLSC